MPAEWALVHVNFARGIDQKTDDFAQDLTRILVGKNVRFEKLGLLEKRIGHRALDAAWFHREDNNGDSYNLDKFKKNGGRIVGDYRGTLVASDGYSLGTYINKPISNNNSTFLPESFFYADNVPEATVEWRGVASHDSWIVNQDVAYADGFVAHVYECFSEGTPNATNTWNAFLTVEDYSNRSPVISHKRVSTSTSAKLRKPRVCWSGGSRMLISAFNDANSRMEFYYWTPTSSPQSISNTGKFITGATIHYDMVGLGNDYASLCMSDNSNVLSFYSIYKDGTALGPVVGLYTGAAVTAISLSYNASRKQTAVIWQDDSGGGSYDLYVAIINQLNPVFPIVDVLATRFVSGATQPVTVSSCLFLDDGTVQVITSSPTSPINEGHASDSFPSGSGYKSDIYTLSPSMAVTGHLPLPWCILSSRPFLVSDQNQRIYCVFNAGGARYDTTINRLVADSSNSGGQIGNYVDTRWPGFVDSAQWSAVLVDLAVNSSMSVVSSKLSLRPVAVALPRTSHPATWGPQYMAPSSIVGIGNSVFLTTTPGKSSNDGRSFVTELAYNFLDTNSLEPCKLGESLSLSGGVPSTFDGHRVSEIGYIYRCEKPGLVYNVADGAFFWLDADFGSGRGPGIDVAANESIELQYMVIYRYVDKRGEVHRSAPSDVLFVNLVSDVSPRNVGFKLRIPCLSLTTRQDQTSPYPQIICELYRTKNHGKLFYLVNDFNIFKENEFTNDPSAEYIEIFDTRPDGAALLNSGKSFIGPLASQPTPYTVGGVLPNTHPGCFLSEKTFRNRLLGLGGDRKTAWFSKLYTPGDAVSFTDGFTLTFDETVRLIGLGVLDNKAFFFSETEIYKVEGEGPTDVGTQNDYGTPERIASDVGCIDARSIVSGPNGVYFKGTPGIFRITRDLNVEFIGAAVEDFTDEYTVVTSAVMIPNQQLIAWTLSKESEYPSHTNGIRVVYNYLFDAWSHDEIQTIGGTSGALISQSLWDGVAVSLDEQGVIYLEDESTNLDIGNWVEYEALTGYLRMSGLQGYQVVRMLSILAKRESPHDLIVEVANDYSNDFHQVWNITDMILDERSLESFRFRLSRMKCQNLKVRIRDKAPSQGTIGTGKGLSLRGLTFDVMQMPGIVRSSMEK